MAKTRSTSGKEKGNKITEIHRQISYFEIENNDFIYIYIFTATHKQQYEISLSSQLTSMNS